MHQLWLKDMLTEANYPETGLKFSCDWAYRLHVEWIEVHSQEAKAKLQQRSDSDVDTTKKEKLELPAASSTNENEEENPNAFISTENKEEKKSKPSPKNKDGLVVPERLNQTLPLDVMAAATILAKQKGVDRSQLFSTAFLNYYSNDIDRITNEMHVLMEDWLAKEKIRKAERKAKKNNA